MDTKRHKETHRMPVCWLLVTIVLVNSKVTSAYQLSAPSNYTAFAGVIIVTYSIPQNITLKSGVIQLISTRTNKVVNNEGRMPTGFNEGEVTFRCGVVDHAGTFIFQMLETPGGPLLTKSNVMYVNWPRFMMVLPETYEVLTDDVSLHFQVDGARCDSAHSGSTFWLQLVYYGTNASASSNNGQLVPSAQVIKRQNFTTFTSIHNAEFIFECRLFDRAGVYQMLFRAGPEQHDLVAYSNEMRVTPSNAYSLDSLSPSIYPCKSEVRMQYSQPKCSGNNDKVRLYKQIPQAESSIASPMNLIYVTEKRAQKHKASVAFECELFETNVIGYCFVYMSTAQNGAVVEQKRVCLPTKNYSDSVVDGSWNTWSSWGICSVTCGDGQRSRFRTCDRPKPANGGKFCVGDTVQWENCGTPCREVTSISPEDKFLSDDPMCQCGCDMTSASGRIASSTRMCRGSVMWVITAPSNFIIKLSFKIYTLDGADHHTLLKVRDGDTRQSDLLVRDYGGIMPANVMSSQNVMLVEFVMPVERRRTNVYEIDNQGMVAVYEAVVSNATKVVPPGGGLSTVWQSTVTLIGIVLCVIVIIAAVACAFHHRYSLRHQRRKKMQAHQALLSNGVGVGSPIHSIGSSSVNMSFSDPVSSPTKRSYVLSGVARNAQPQVVGRRDAPIVSPSGSSKKYLARDIANVDSMQYPSPYTLGTGDNDYSQNPNLTPLDGHKLKGHRHHRHGYKKQSHDLDDRYSHRSKHDTDSTTRAYSRSSAHQKPSDFRSPNARSTESHGSLSPTRLDPRNKSFMSAINQRTHIPMADAEDLSPEVTSAGESRRGSRRQLDMMQISNEDIPLEPMYDRPTRRKKHKGNIADTCLGGDQSVQEQRPPVEGRDSWPRKDPHPEDLLRNRQRQHLNDNKPVPMDISQPTTPDTQNANYVPLLKCEGSRPQVRPLPLRNIQKPDGQSPESQYVADRNANTPSSLSSGLSPVLQKTKLFSDASGSRSPSVLFQDPDLEYDDIPEIPGSYFTMDPHAYTLTWSGKKGGPGTPTKHLANTAEERNTSNC